MRRLLVIFLAILAGSAAHAENMRRESAISSTLNLIGPRTPVRSNVELWVVGQGGLSQINSDYDHSQENKNQDVYGAGILMTAGRPSITGELGVLYFQEGINSTNSSNLTKTTSIGDLDYVGIPVVGKWSPIRRGRTRMSMGLGLMQAFYVGSNLKIQTQDFDANGNVVSSSEESKEAEGARKQNVFALATLGGDIGIGRSQDMRIEVVYRRGLLPATEYEHSGLFTNSVVMNLGFGFDI